MNSPHLSVREIQQTDIPYITNYWINSDRAFLEGMGVDMEKLPSEKQWHEMLSLQLSQSYEQKLSYCIIWLIDGEPSGHSNVTDINFGKDAFMHLHLWNSTVRKRGMGAQLVRMTIPYFFKNLELQTLYCEPFAGNIASNKTIEKAGFQFLKEYITIPGSINFEQPVKRWELTRERWQEISVQSGIINISEVTSHYANM